jgi:di/tricarboxylate transporter
MEIIVVFSVFLAVVLLLAFDLLRMDLIALFCLLALAWTGILEPLESLSGFSSNAVIAMVAVMIMGRGIAKTGMMDRFSRLILRAAGIKQPRIIALVSASVGLLSGFIQNVGAAVLFLPAVLTISQREKIPASRLIMPIGFAAILGGNLSMVGSSPLILINDFLTHSALEPYRLLDVTPLGIILLAAGIAYFFLFGEFLLPSSPSVGDQKSPQKELIEAWQLPFRIWHYQIPADSPIIGKKLEETGIWDRYQIHMPGIIKGKTLEWAPWRETTLAAYQNLVLLGEESQVRRFASDYGLRPADRPDRSFPLSDPDRAGFAEVVIPPRSTLVGETLRKFGLRRRYAVEPIMFFHKGEKVRGDFSDKEISAGDMLVIYGSWEKILDLKGSRDFVLITRFEGEIRERSKAWLAALCFASAVALALAGFPISVSFLSGAAAMILTRVLSMEDAYQAVDWKVVFFLAGLVPLGLAMGKTGAAGLLAGKIMGVVQGSHPVYLLFAVAAISTLFSLFMSNVASTVVLAPLVISMGEIGGVDPRPLVLLVAVCSGNSFLLPTHQVNALLKSPGGYRNMDYMRAGAGMTLIFLLLAVTIFYFFYLG